MLTKYILTIGGIAHEVPDECLANWDDISFSLKRTDYSGVMRQFSTEFVFVGESLELLRDAYLSEGVLVDAQVAVYTINNDHTWSKRFEAPLDFSSVEIENGKLTINAIDNTLAALLRNKKGQKYEFPLSGFETSEVLMKRITIYNMAKWALPGTQLTAGHVEVILDDDESVIISKEYIEPKSSTGQRHFATIHESPSPTASVSMQGTVRCFLNPGYVASGNASAALYTPQMQLGWWNDEDNSFHLWSTLISADVTHRMEHGTNYYLWIGGTSRANYSSLNALIAAANNSSINPYGLQVGMFGVVGSYSVSNPQYWTDNVLYEYRGNDNWVSKGAPGEYYQDRSFVNSSTLPNLTTSDWPMLTLTHEMTLFQGKMTMQWSDTVHNEIAVDVITPIQMLDALVGAVAPGATASIAVDDDGLLEETYIVPAESLRRMPEAKTYSTFQQFADWMEAVFGYTFRIVGNEVQFVHRSEVFSDEVGKVITQVNGVKYSVNDDLLYTEVDAGYGKKSYGEIDGRLETNFTNYYETGYNVTDKRLSLISKYRADAYGIEFTIRKGEKEKEKETKDDATDEDVFFIRALDVDDELKYNINNNAAYSPASCVGNNAAFIAVMGNGADILLKMTSSDGNNELSDIIIGDPLFTIGELEFSTDDTEVAEDMNSLVQLDYKGFRYTGYIKQAEARYGRVDGMDYTLIVKSITRI